MTDWVRRAASAAEAARAYATSAQECVTATIAPGGKVDSTLADREQRLVHGFAWIATTAEAIGAVADWAALRS